MASASTGKLSGELARREKILKSVASEDTQIDMFGLEKDPEKSHLGTIASGFDSAMGVPKMIRCAIEAEKAGYQAVIGSCAGDPGVRPLKEVLTIPVIPPGNTAKHMCSMMGRFSLLSPGKEGPRRVDMLERGGLMNLVSRHGIGFSVLGVRENPDKAYEAMVRQGKIAAEEFRAESVTYGCMSMAFLPRALNLSDDIGIMAFNPLQIAVKMAELYIDLGIKHSKLHHPIPVRLHKHLGNV